MSRQRHLFTIEAQRHAYLGDAGWIECSLEEAERFAIIQATVFTEGKKRYRTRRVIETFHDHNHAQRKLAHYLRKEKRR